MPDKTWQFSFKPTFLHELYAFEPRTIAQLLKKIDCLAEDPTADGHAKKRLKGLDGQLHRLRSGDYRILYTYREPCVSLLSVRLRNEQTYDHDLESEFLEAAEIPEVVTTQPDHAQTWNEWLGHSKKSAQIPRVIDKALLDSLRVPAQFHDTLTRVGTEDELLDCPVPQDVLNVVIDAVTSRPIAQVANQPDLVLNEPEDLLRFRQGELLGFLLRLDPDQEALARWALKAKGATLLKGSPGTGKSTVALYRVREILAALRKAKLAAPKILFTTYTRALTRVSEQLLTSLLGKEGMERVEVKTADSILRQIAIDGGAPATLVTDSRKALVRALEEANFQGSNLKIASQKAAVTKMSRDFLLEEILGIIEGRGLSTLEEYLDAARPGRRSPLTKVQREAVWRVREAFLAQLAKEGVTTLEGWRRRAAERIRSGEVPARYDAVVIDEAQDLSPTAIAALVGLCKTPQGVFLTADANQSIYTSGFRWSDIHEWLRFQGRTAVLKANYRSTREVGEGAFAYLRAGSEEPEIDERVDAAYVHAGPIPAVRAVEDFADEPKLLARFFRQATRALKLGLGGCAVLCPTNEAATQLAAALTAAGLSARKVDANDLDLRDPGVKVLTLKNAKGLEFPIVALAGFSGTRFPNYLPQQATDEERTEILARERRTMFVAMTRAMRALLVVTPSGSDSSLLQGFGAPFWNDGSTDVTTARRSGRG